jgi:tetratricopeptide (TPR) repeat protein
MIQTRSFKQGMSKVRRHWRARQFDLALGEVDGLLKSWPGSAYLHTLWAALVQLQDSPTHSLDEAKRALQRAMEIDESSPAAAIDLGHFLDAVEDDPQAASKPFSEGIVRARRLLMDGLLGQARALLQIGKRDEAMKCLMESLYLANIGQLGLAANGTNAVPDVLWRDPNGQLLALQLKGPFAMEVEDLLQEFFPRATVALGDHA